MTGDVKHLVAVMALGCAVAGCQSHAANQSAPAGSGSAAPQSAQRIDACAMLSPQDISGVLGVTVQGKSTGKNPQMGDCSWENPSNMESVTIEISNPGTAPNNKLPRRLVSSTVQARTRGHAPDGWRRGRVRCGQQGQYRPGRGAEALAGPGQLGRYQPREKDRTAGAQLNSAVARDHPTAVLMRSAGAPASAHNCATASADSAANTPNA